MSHSFSAQAFIRLFITHSLCARIIKYYGSKAESRRVLTGGIEEGLAGREVAWWFVFSSGKSAWRKEGRGLFRERWEIPLPLRAEDPRQSTRWTPGWCKCSWHRDNSGSYRLLWLPLPRLTVPFSFRPFVSIFFSGPKYNSNLASIVL